MALIDCFEHSYFHLKFTGHLLRCRHGSVLYKRRAKAIFFALTDELVAFSSDLCAARMEQFLPADARGIFTLKESQCLSCAAGKNDLRNAILYLLWEGESNCSNKSFSQHQECGWGAGGQEKNVFWLSNCLGLQL